MKTSRPSNIIILIIAPIFLIWTLLVNIDRRVDESYDVRGTILSSSPVYDQYVKASNEMANLINSYGVYKNYDDYSAQYTKLANEKLMIEKQLLDDNERSIQNSEKRIKRISILYLIYPKYQQKDELYLMSLRQFNNTYKSEIIALTNAVETKGLNYTDEQVNEETLLVNKMKNNAAIGKLAQTTFEDYYWKYNMHKSLIYQWYWGTLISVISTVGALSFLIWSLIELIKSSRSKQPTHIRIILGFSALIFFYSFMFFGPLMLLPKIPYISW